MGVTNKTLLFLPMFKAFALAAISALTFGVAMPAQASTPRPYEFAGNYGTATDNGIGNFDYITVSGPSGNTTLKVLCTGGGGNTWNSWGNFTQNMNQALANTWCQHY